MPLSTEMFSDVNQSTPYLIGSGTASTITGTSASGIIIWRQWCESSASVTAGDGNWFMTNYPEVHTMGTSSTNQVWTIWAAQNATVIAASATPSRQEQMIARARARFSPEEHALELAACQYYDRRYEEEKAKRVLAEKKAEILLRQLLTPEQQETLDQKKCFYLHSGGKKYRIERGRTGNVKLVDERDQVLESYCIHPQVNCPDADTMLAQKLLIETDLEKFERVANVSRPGIGLVRAGRGLTG